jgi:hypothetical protein
VGRLVNSWAVRDFAQKFWGGSEILRKKSSGVSDFARHSIPSFVYKSAKKSLKTVISHHYKHFMSYIFFFLGGVRDFAQKL